jgi:hypothetical protein
VKRHDVIFFHSNEFLTIMKLQVYSLMMVFYCKKRRNYKRLDRLLKKQGKYISCEKGGDAI